MKFKIMFMKGVVQTLEVIKLLI